jgi:hypothetical protein
MCNYCDKHFKHLSELVIHNRVHTGARPYSCNGCNMKFSVMSNLRRHERNHSCPGPHASCKEFQRLGHHQDHVRRDLLMRRNICALIATADLGWKAISQGTNVCTPVSSHIHVDIAKWNSRSHIMLLNTNGSTLARSHSRAVSVTSVSELRPKWDATYVYTLETDHGSVGNTILTQQMWIEALKQQLCGPSPSFEWQLHGERLLKPTQHIDKYHTAAGWHIATQIAA